MMEERGNITIEDIDQAILSLEEEGLPMGILPDPVMRSEPEIRPASGHRRAVPPVTKGRRGLIVILLAFILFSVALGYYNFVGIPKLRGSVAPQAGTGLPLGQVASTPRPAVNDPGEQNSGPVARSSRPRKSEPAAVQSKPAPVRESSTSSPVPAAPTEKTAVAAEAPTAYTLQAGIFRRKSGLEKAEKMIRDLGFEPEVVTLTEETEMTRLLVGTFPKAEAQSFLAGLRAEVPDAFLLSQGDQALVYAGSFSIAGHARQLAARLAEKGIKAEEVVVRVPVSGYRVNFGAFASQAAARKAADRAVAAGLEAPLIKRL